MKYSSDDLKRDVESAFKNFNNPVAGMQSEFAKVIRYQQEVVKSVQESRTVLETAKAFLKDPKGEGIKIVKDGLRAADKFFASLFKLLTKDIGALISQSVKACNTFLVAQVLKLLNSLKILNTALKLAVIKELVKLASRLEKSSNKALQAAAKVIQGNAAKLIRDLLNSFTKAVGPSSSLFKTIGQNSKALAALKDVPKAMSGLVAFAKIGVKILPLIGAIFDLKWKNDTRQFLVDLKQQQKLNAQLADKQFLILGNKLKALETKGAIDYTKISSATASAIKSSLPSDLAKKSDLNGINYTQQLSTIAQGVSALKNLGQPQTIDYSRIQNGVTAAVTAAKTPTKEPTTIDYLKVTAAAAAALTAANLSPSSISDSVVSKTKEPTAIDYQKVTTAAAAALTAANLSPSSISDSVTAKTKSVTPAELAQILEKNNTTQSLAQAAAIKQGMASVKVEIPTDVARKSDVEAIPSKIPKTTLDLAPVLSRLTTIDNTLVNLGQRFKPVDLNPVQDKLNQIQNQVSQIPSQVTNNLNTVSNSIVNSLSNFITNNNTTIINKMEPGLNPDAIINPIKTHINTQVAQPLATTMDVLNVNDLKRGVTMSAEAVIKASGFQQYGQSDTGTATATNLIGLTAMIAAPLFMRAGFHQLGTTFPADMRDPTGAKVTPTTALSTSHWQFNQVSNLVGIPAKQMVTSKTGVISALSFKNQSDAIENIHAQNLGMEQDISAIEKYCFKITQAVEMVTQVVLQNKHDIEVLIQESGAKTGQKIIMRPGAVTHGVGDSFFDKLMNIAESAMVVRKWDGDIDAKQLALKTNMESQIAAMSNKFDFDKTDPKLPILDRPKQNPKTKDDEAWKRYVNTVENPGTLRQSVGLPIPEIKEIKLGSTREIPKPTTDPDKLLGS